MIYQRGDASAEEIAGAVAAVLADSQLATSEVARRAAAAGLDPEVLASVSVEVREDSQGLEPILTSIVVGLTVRAGEAIAESVWKKAIWPLVRRRLGARALLGEAKTNNVRNDALDPENTAAAGDTA